MTAIGIEAIQAKGWWATHRWLLLRRLSQLSVMALFMAGPWLGLWLIKGNLNHSRTLDVLPMTDPLVLIQSLAAGHAVERNALLGLAVVLLFYLIIGGRAYCSWVCPVNVVTDAAAWLRRRIGIRGSAHISRSARYWILGMTLALAAITGSIAWEMINPVSMLHRGLIFGMGAGWMVILAVLLFDLFVMSRGWCGHLCPVGACFSLIGRWSLLRVSAERRDSCNNCMDCFAVCPEPQVLRSPLKGAAKGAGPVVMSPNCTNCGRCIDICSKDVFTLSSRFNNPVSMAGDSATAPK
ncbi:MAG: quinol dehydrogenase ferredoxin subunit NapH [Burkholderiales bacterium]|jgi:ferredoxin-type protein NapH